MKYLIILAVYLSGCAAFRPHEEPSTPRIENVSEEFKEFEVSETIVEKKETPVIIPKSKKKKDKEVVVKEVVNQIIPPKIFNNIIKPEKNYYKLYAFGIKAGELIIESSDGKFINNRAVWHLSSHMYTTGVAALSFKLNNKVDSYVDKEHLYSFRYQLSAVEGPMTKNHLEVYDSQKKKSFSIKKEKKEGEAATSIKMENDISPFPQDLLSVFFYLRTLDFTQKNQTLNVTNFDQKVSSDLTVLGSEKVDTDFGSILCWKLSLHLKLKDKEQTHFVWISQSADRLLVKMEANSKIGVVRSIISKP